MYIHIKNCRVRLLFDLSAFDKIFGQKAYILIPMKKTKIKHIIIGVAYYLNSIVNLSPLASFLKFLLLSFKLVDYSLIYFNLPSLSSNISKDSLNTLPTSIKSLFNFCRFSAVLPSRNSFLFLVIVFSNLINAYCLSIVSIRDLKSTFEVLPNVF